MNMGEIAANPQIRLSDLEVFGKTPPSVIRQARRIRSRKGKGLFPGKLEIYDEERDEDELANGSSHQ